MEKVHAPCVSTNKRAAGRSTAQKVETDNGLTREIVKAGCESARENTRCTGRTPQARERERESVIGW